MAAMLVTVYIVGWLSVATIAAVASHRRGDDWGSATITGLGCGMVWPVIAGPLTLAAIVYPLARLVDWITRRQETT